MFNTIKGKILDLMFFGSRDTLVTVARIIYISFKLKYAHAFVEDQYSKLGEDRATSVSMGKRNMGKEKFASLCKTYKIIVSGGSFPKHSYTFFIDESTVVSSMQNFQEKLHLKSGRLRNVTIAGNNFKILPVCEHGSKAFEGMFKTCKYSLPEGRDPVVKPTFNDTVKLLMMCGESKYGLSTYYIKF